MRGTPRAAVQKHGVRAARSLPALMLAGCFGTPSPLAPGLAGSVGWPHHGVQTGAIELPDDGPGFVRYRDHGGYHWGQPALVNGIVEAARTVHEAFPGGAPLVVGDLSARHGGQITRHQSHRSGRDVDLLWYVTTPDGRPIRNPSFTQLERDGTARAPGYGYVRLDVPREWLLIKSLLGSAQLEVQWLYSSSIVEGLVLDYAVAQGENAELIHRAREVMSQPVDSLPHDDHLHLRIACSPESQVSGCEGGGPQWSWLAPAPWLEPGADDDVVLLGEGSN
jgi:penicillin-insensitive murein DD-endopeptidase